MTSKKAGRGGKRDEEERGTRRNGEEGGTGRVKKKVVKKNEK